MDIEKSIASKFYRSKDCKQRAHVVIYYYKLGIGAAFFDSTSGQNTLDSFKSIVLEYEDDVCNFISLLRNILKAKFSKEQYCSSSFLADSKIRIEINSKEKTFLNIFCLDENGQWFSVLSFYKKKDLVNFFYILKSIILFGVWMDTDKHDIVNCYLSTIIDGNLIDPSEFLLLTRDQQGSIVEKVIHELSLQSERNIL